MDSNPLEFCLAASNLTEVEDRILMLEFDQDSAFNITTYMLDELHDHSSLLERMNQTAARQNNFDVSCETFVVCCVVTRIDPILFISVASLFIKCYIAVFSHKKSGFVNLKTFVSG